jgi:hypothetical protein
LLVPTIRSSSAPVGEGESFETAARRTTCAVSSSVSVVVSLAVSVRWRLMARLSNSTASSSANGGQPATATANALNSGAAATLAHSDKQIPNANADHAAHRPVARPAWPVFHSSTVAVVNKPSTINGQIAAVASSAPNRTANSRPCRYEA